MSLSIIEPVAKAHGRLAAVSRWNPAKQPDAERDLRASRLAAHIEATVAAAPPLTRAQLGELGRLLTQPGVNLSRGA